MRRPVTATAARALQTSRGAHHEYASDTLQLETVKQKQPRGYYQLLLVRPLLTTGWATEVPERRLLTCCQHTCWGPVLDKLFYNISLKIYFYVIVYLEL